MECIQINFTKKIEILETRIKFIFPNYQDYGYGIFLLDEKSRAYVLANIQTEKDDFLRSMMWGSLWDSVRFYELAPEDYVELVIKNLELSNRKRIPTSVDPRLDPKYVETFPETDESTISTLLNRVGIGDELLPERRTARKVRAAPRKGFDRKNDAAVDSARRENHRLSRFQPISLRRLKAVKILKSLLNPEKGKAKIRVGKIPIAFRRSKRKIVSTS